MHQTSNTFPLALVLAVLAWEWDSDSPMGIIDGSTNNAVVSNPDPDANPVVISVHSELLLLLVVFECVSNGAGIVCGNGNLLPVPLPLPVVPLPLYLYL